MVYKAAYKQFNMVVTLRKLNRPPTERKKTQVQLLLSKDILSMFSVHIAYKNKCLTTYALLLFTTMF